MGRAHGESGEQGRPVDITTDGFGYIVGAIEPRSANRRLREGSRGED
jgi:hypothetical protein